MVVYFLDASALAKRYLTEKGSVWVRGITDPSAGNDCWISTMSGVEVLSALYRRVRMRAIPPAQAGNMDVQFRNDLAANLQGIEPIPVILHEAMRLISIYPLRAYDAVQLGTVLYLRSQNVAAGIATPVFVVSDNDLTRAAAAEGLSTEDPNLHP
jgi:predicted nucleic acid-binding protein